MNKKIFIGIGIFWLIIILGFIAVKEFTLQTGEEVLLKTRPVDPRDLFRGDYVILSYEISRLDLKTLESDTAEFEENDKVYILLDIVDGYGVPKGIFLDKPLEGLFLKGTITGDSKEILLVQYGIESYFVPEGKGRGIERARSGNLDVKVAIDKNGNVGIKNLILDGQVVRFD